jgi:hypothetical protein
MLLCGCLLTDRAREHANQHTSLISRIKLPWHEQHKAM